MSIFKDKNKKTGTGWIAHIRTKGRNIKRRFKRRADAVLFKQAMILQILTEERNKILDKLPNRRIT